MQVFGEELRQYPPDLDALPGREDGVYVVAEVQGEIVGVLYIRRGQPYEWQRHLDLQPSAADGFEFGRLCVCREHRSCGISTALMAAAVQYMRARDGRFAYNFARVELVPMYKALGSPRCMGAPRHAATSPSC
jgi:GNAT superfamily N-acetyltransferase